jgi:tetraacyldisaccharide 4'-kinase
VILDDGFQQWKLDKDLNIVAIDATEPFGNCRLIPRGILREPLSSLRRADIFVLTKTNLNPDITDIKSFLNSINPGAAVMESIHRPIGFYRIGKADELLGPDILKAKTVSLVSAIGDPDSFENLIRSLGIDIGLTFVFTDHHPYSVKDLENIIKESQKKDIDTIVTTEKDAVRLSQLSAVPAWPAGRDSQLSVLVLRIEIKITKDEQEFHNRLLKLYSL